MRYIGKTLTPKKVTRNKQVLSDFDFKAAMAKPAIDPALGTKTTVGAMSVKKGLMTMAQKFGDSLLLNKIEGINANTLERIFNENKHKFEVVFASSEEMDDDTADYYNRTEHDVLRDLIIDNGLWW